MVFDTCFHVLRWITSSGHLRRPARLRRSRRPSRHRWIQTMNPRRHRPRILTRRHRRRRRRPSPSRRPSRCRRRRQSRSRSGARRRRGARVRRLRRCTCSTTRLSCPRCGLRFLESVSSLRAECARAGGRFARQVRGAEAAADGAEEVPRVALRPAAASAAAASAGVTAGRHGRRRAKVHGLPNHRDKLIC